jgi:hypothetical protein
MKPKYRIYTLGTIPPDLKERITAIHAAGILKGKSADVQIAQVRVDQNRGLIGKTTTGN